MQGRLNGGGNLYSTAADGVITLTANAIENKLLEDFGVSRSMVQNKQLIDAMGNPGTYLTDRENLIKAAVTKSSTMMGELIKELEAQGIPQESLVLFAERAAHRDFKSRLEVIDLKFPEGLLDGAVRGETNGQLGLTNSKRKATKKRK